jgi:hypothetical protein
MKKGEIKIVSSCANLECEKISTTLRVYNVFSVCYLFDVSLLNELYWHLGDITMNMMRARVEKTDDLVNAVLMH